MKLKSSRWRKVREILFDHRYECDCVICRTKRATWKACEEGGGHEFGEYVYYYDDHKCVQRCKICRLEIPYRPD